MTEICEELELIKNARVHASAKPKKPKPKPKLVEESDESEIDQIINAHTNMTKHTED
ncbi:hypothetical protein [Shewanella sp. M-Br]|uniref:hypothetical protein n=1 Tax=Shewanella sp. M-Br TaxID=2495595 RepID=UPI002949D847|nr:hypothetical protein SMBr_32660 [Shewanella sp. M-Br]